MQPLLGPRQRARLARQYGCLTVGSITCGVVLLVLMALVAFGAVDNDPATAADGPGGPVGDAVKIAVGVAGAVTFLVLMPLMAWRRSRRWSASVGARPVAIVSATVARRYTRGRSTVLAELVMPDGERWTVELIQGSPQRKPVQPGDGVVVEIYPVEDGRCVGAFRVERTGAVWAYSTDRLPARVAAMPRPPA